MKSHQLIKVAFCYFLIFFSFPLNAVDWTGGGLNDDYSDVNNWDGAVPNGPLDVATFPNLPGNIDVQLDISPTVRNLNILKPGPGYVYINGGLNQTLTINNYITLGADNTYLKFDYANIDLTNNAGVYLYTGDNTQVYSYGSTFNFATDPGASNIIGPGDFLCYKTTLSGNVQLLGGDGTRLAIEGSSSDVDNASFDLVIAETLLDIFLQGGSTSLAFNATGLGDIQVTAQETEIMTLTGTIDTTGSFRVAGDGVVVVSTQSIPTTAGSGGISIGNASTLRFAQSTNGSCNNVISGGGTLEKNGAGTLTLGATNTHTGGININAGTLSVTGSTAQSNLTTIASGATLTGNGTVSSLRNQGRVHPGLTETQSLNVNGEYTQTGDGTLKSLLSTTSASVLNVTGEVDLDGALRLELAPGVYTGGTSFTVLDADSITGDFATFSDGDPQNVWVKTVDPVQGTVVVTLPQGSSVIRLPVALSSLRGNSRVVGDYMYSDASFVSSNSDLMAVSNAMLALPGPTFEDALIRVSPLASASLPLTTFQGDLQMAVVLDKQFQKNNEKKKLRSKKYQKTLDAPCSAIPKTGVFVEPIGVFYHQSSSDGAFANEGQIGFQSYTYGAGIGWEQVFNNHFVFEAGVGYTHSNLVWEDNFGNSKWNTAYVAPFFGWFNEHAFANIMVMGGFNFFNTDRKVIFPNIERVARSRYTSYDVLVRANGGAFLSLGKGFWIQPEGTLNYLTIFTEGYTERDAGSISLQVQSNTNYILQPSFRSKLVKEFKTKRFCYAPNIYAGWLANILLESQTLSARFKDAPNQIFFNIGGYYKTRNQLILGGEFYAERFEMFNLSVNFEADFLSRFEVYTAKIKFEWMF